MLDNRLWVKDIELNEISELDDEYVSVGWKLNGIDFEIANNLQRVEHNQEVVQVALQELLNENLHEENALHCSRYLVCLFL